MSQISEDTFNRPNSEQITVVLRALSKLTSRPPEEIKPYIDELIARLSIKVSQGLVNASFYETATHEEWSAEFHRWIDSHQDEVIPVLSDEAMNRESMYPDRW